LNILTGVDIIKIDRIKKSIEELGEPFLKKIYTGLEIEYCEKRKVAKFESYAVRYAAKEAVSKAIGTGIGERVSLNEIQVENNNLGAPKIELFGNTLETAHNLGIDSFSLSLSHCKEYAVAFVVATKNTKDG
jgi:holo-[acyl-carrier protein] synthase